MADSENFPVSGVAGVGMSALAELLLAFGHDVSGSGRTHDQGAAVRAKSRTRRSTFRRDMTT